MKKLRRFIKFARKLFPSKQQRFSFPLFLYCNDNRKYNKKNGKAYTSGNKKRKYYRPGQGR